MIVLTENAIYTVALTTGELSAYYKVNFGVQGVLLD